MNKRQNRWWLLLIFIAAFVAALIIEYHPPKKHLRIPFVKSAVKNTDKKSGTVNPNKLDINTATKTELTELDGIGEKLAERIIEYREKSGGFEAIEELANVPGIGEKMVDKLRDRICVN